VHAAGGDAAAPFMPHPNSKPSGHKLASPIHAFELISGLLKHCQYVHEFMFNKCSSYLFSELFEL